MYVMDSEPKKRVTKNDKKHKKHVYSQKHIRMLLKQMEATKRNGPVHPADRPLLSDGRVDVPRR